MSKETTRDLSAEINRILNIKDSYEAPAAMMKEILNPETRRKMFMDFIDLFDGDMSYEWFEGYFEDEHADRRTKKQDFTPTSVSKLISEVLQSKPSDDVSIIEEPAAGTGSTIIQHWNYSRKGTFPWTFRPDDYLYLVTEKSRKTLPFLIFNIMLRGMNAIVIHGDALTREADEAYWVWNEKNTAMEFSDIFVIPHTKRNEEMLHINFKLS